MNSRSRSPQSVSLISCVTATSPSAPPHTAWSGSTRSHRHGRQPMRHHRCMRLPFTSGFTPTVPSMVGNDGRTRLHPAARPAVRCAPPQSEVHRHGRLAHTALRQTPQRRSRAPAAHPSRRCGGGRRCRPRRRNSACASRRLGGSTAVTALTPLTRATRILRRLAQRVRRRRRPPVSITKPTLPSARTTSRPRGRGDKPLPSRGSFTALRAARTSVSRGEGMGASAMTGQPLAEPAALPRPSRLSAPERPAPRKAAASASTGAPCAISTLRTASPGCGAPPLALPSCP